MVKNDHKVCVFDSGIGGLNLLYECVRRLPCVDFTYFADNFRMPYGNKDKSILINYVDEIFDKINKINPSAALIACNTVTASCIDYLREKYEFPILGIQPAVKPAVKSGGKCLVLATPITAESAAMKNLVNKYGEGRTQVVAIPQLAALVEEKTTVISREEVEKYLPKVKPDTVVLGCTHYIYVK
ncbi:MAG: glutamate racemase, partial [Clostridia bacterium]|nr:glutamate racemase [Clostridia bacterium]